MNRRMTKSSKHRLMVFGSLSLIIIFYTLFSFFSYIYNIKSLQNQNQDLKDQLLSLKDKKEDLKNDIEKLRDPLYLANYAREHYSYSKDGEWIIKVDKKQDEVVKQEEENFDYNLLIFFSLIAGGCITLYILKRVL